LFFLFPAVLYFLFTLSHSVLIVLSSTMNKVKRNLGRMQMKEKDYCPLPANSIK
jgi:hypothetical protein